MALAPNPALVGYWDFDESIDQVAADSSGNGNDGRLGSDPFNPDEGDPIWVASDMSDMPLILADPGQINFFAVNNIPDQTFFIRNVGSDTLNWQITEDCPWLEASTIASASDAEPNQVTLTASAVSLPSGLHTCDLTISNDQASNSPFIIPITLYVGTSWFVPGDYPTIQSAIDASLHSDTIVIADGIYSGPGNRDIDFKGKAITLKSENGPENCTIDCQGGEVDPHRGFHFHSDEGSNSILEGFSIANGYIVGDGGNGGGGIYCPNSSPTIRNCVVRNCSAGSGGAI